MFLEIRQVRTPLLFLLEFRIFEKCSNIGKNCDSTLVIKQHYICLNNHSTEFLANQVRPWILATILFALSRASNVTWFTFTESSSHLLVQCVTSHFAFLRSCDHRTYMAGCTSLVSLYVRCVY